ncbi:TetR/AcrR family transcriptional regulator [Pseudonocardia zijingensis]
MATPRARSASSAITTAAVVLADEEGVDAVSMRKVAARMDHSPMALYPHVGNKDDLTELMYDVVLGELDLTGIPSGSWRDDLARLAREMRRIHHAHPWLGRFGHRPSLGPNALRFLEAGLACVDGLGLDVDGMLDLLSTALQFTRGFVGQELGEAEAQRRTGMDLPAPHRAVHHAAAGGGWAPLPAPAGRGGRGPPRPGRGVRTPPGDGAGRARGRDRPPGLILPAGVTPLDRTSTCGAPPGRRRCRRPGGLR